MCSRRQTAPTAGQSQKLSSIRSSRRRQGGWSCASEGNPTIRHVDNQRRLERAFSQRANASLSLILSLPHVSHRLPWTNAACLARAAQRIVLTALRQSMPAMRLPEFTYVCDTPQAFCPDSRLQSQKAFHSRHVNTRDGGESGLVRRYAL